jgi:hypothetical protein
MITKVHPPRSDFQATWNYIRHDKGTRKTAHRLGFTSILNMDTDDGDEAIAQMIRHQQKINAEKLGRGGRGSKPIKNASLHWNLSRHPGQENLTQEQWEKKARSYLEEIGLGHHYTVIVEHTDEPQGHIHGITSLIDPITGKLNKRAVSNLKLRSSRWAQKQEELEGKIRCRQRVENNARRAKGEYVKYREAELDQKAMLTRLLLNMRDARQFETDVHRQLGLRIGAGSKGRIVLIDRDGRMHSISRQIDGMKIKDIRAKLAGLKLRDVDDLRAEILAERKRERRRDEQRDERERTARILTGVDRSRMYWKQRLAEKDAEIAKAYGRQEKELKDRLARNEGAQKKSWVKITGAYKRRQEEIEADRQSLADIEKRKAEMRQTPARMLEQRTELAAKLRQRIEELQRPGPPVDRDFKKATAQAGRTADAGTKDQQEPSRRQQAKEAGKAIAEERKYERVMEEERKAAAPTEQEKKAEEYRKKLAAYHERSKPAPQPEKEAKQEKKPEPEKVQTPEPANDPKQAEYQRQLAAYHQQRQAAQARQPEPEPRPAPQPVRTPEPEPVTTTAPTPQPEIKPEFDKAAAAQQQYEQQKAAYLEQARQQAQQQHEPDRGPEHER